MKNINRTTLKLEARKKLQGNWGWAVGITAIILIISLILAGPIMKITIIGDGNVLHFDNTAGFIGTLIADFIALSLAITSLNFMRGKRDTFFNETFSAFTQGRFVPEFLTYLLVTLYTFLWTLLLIVPGIIKGYSYALTPYIVNDLVASGQDVHPNEVIQDSNKMMKGYKWQLFVLDLSFIGWSILTCMTFGIGSLWLIPYIQTTKANFYREIAGDTFLKKNN